MNLFSHLASVGESVTLMIFVPHDEGKSGVCEVNSVVSVGVS